jgi:hypothetical protein
MDISGAAVAAPLAPIIQVGAKGAEPFPMIDKIWFIFTEKGIRTVFVSVGTSASALADLDIAESIGCPVNIIPLKASEKAQWESVAAVLKARKQPEGELTPFLAGVEEKWVLPKNIRTSSAVPWPAKGAIEVPTGESVPTEKALTVITDICKGMRLKEGEGSRIDILKVDTTTSAPELAGDIALSILQAGFRPAILLIHWAGYPDLEAPYHIQAGSIQTMGYRLMAKTDKKFLYYYTDLDLFESCSWEDTSCDNPMVNELRRALMKPRIG